MRRTQLVIGAVVTALVLYCAAVRLWAAPRPRAGDRAEPAAPERVAGLYAVSLDSPTIEVALPDGGTRVYWLAWADKEAERNALGGRRPGDPLVAVGRCGVGGRFWYVTVESLETP